MEINRPSEECITSGMVIGPVGYFCVIFHAGCLIQIMSAAFILPENVGRSNSTKLSSCHTINVSRMHDFHCCQVT